MLDPGGNELASVAAELQEAQISTIHAFALNIIREEALFLPSGSARPVSPRRRSSSRRGRKGAGHAGFRLVHEESSARNELGRFLDTAAGEYLADAVTEYSPEAASFAPRWPTYWRAGESLPRAVATRGRPALLRRGEESHSRYLPSLPRGCRGVRGRTASVRSAESAFKRLDALRKEWPEDALPPEEPDGLLAFATRLFDGILGNLRGATTSQSGKLAQEALGCSFAEHRERFGTLWTGLRFLSQEPPEFDVRLRSVLLRTSAMVWETYREFRRRRGLLSYDDMIRLAADIAASENSARSVRTFREILVDEYQDTNPLQDRLIDSVAAEGCRRFLVGDPKQSIYRFRHADPTLFGERIASPSEETRYIPLQTSFRTRPALLKEINGLFGGIWRNGIASTLPTPYEELLFPENPEMRELREETSLPPLLPVFRRQRENEPVAETRKRVALALGEKLLELHGQPVWNKKNKQMLPAEWRDMTILVPSRSSRRARGDAAPSFGIPVAFEKGKRYFDRGEIGDLTTAIRMLAFPDDRAAALGFLASPSPG